MGTVTLLAGARKTGAVLRARRRFFRLDDFNGPRPAVDRELCRLVAAGELRRIRNGLYWRGPKTLLGMAYPTTDELLAQLLAGCTYGPAGLSAANELGLTTQVPARTTVAVVGRPPRDLPTLRFVQRAGCRGRQAAGLLPAEIAVLEALTDADDLLEDPAQLGARFEQLVAADAVRPDALRQAATTEPRRVRDRLDVLLDQVDVGRGEPVPA